MWPKNSDERSHRRGVGLFIREILCDTHSTASVVGQLERWLTACREILMSGPVRTVLGGERKNPNVIPSKVLLPVGDVNTHLIHSFLWANLSPHPKRCLDRFSHFCMAHDRDRQTDRQTK